MDIKLVFEDWKDKYGKSIYNTEKGLDLSTGPFHSGTTFDATIDLHPNNAEELNDAITEGFQPIFAVDLKESNNAPPTDISPEACYARHMESVNKIIAQHKIYVISGSTGAYENLREWIVGYATDEEHAKKIIAFLNNLCKKNGVHFDDKFDYTVSKAEEVTAAMKCFDQRFSVEYTGTGYSYEAVSKLDLLIS